ncbi:MAG TPA: zinc-dependent peptidase [Bacteroidales bacterium]|nr:zinc-dependent peptidase [Bacteroidales bacterium]HPS17428.1 zinc-dependent peptidase [Bacteroidales bacterium]
MPYLVAIALIVFFLVLKYKIGNAKNPDFGGNSWSRKKLDSPYIQILMQHSNYYRSLNDDLKKSYGNRIIRFIESKEYIAKSGLELTDLMKVLIADSAIKLTFGIKSYLFEKYEKILIFKGEFFSDFSHSKAKGETNPRGIIVFSFKDFLEGDLNTSDNINLGLHEFAHALMTQTVDPGGYEDDYFLAKIDTFLDFYGNSEKNNKVKSSQYFRKYAFRNEMEFFAVAVEHFFETPSLFIKEIPELYYIMCELLNQNPAALYINDKTPVAVPLSIKQQKPVDSIPPGSAL